MSVVEVTVSDVESRWRELTDEERTRCAALIPDALDKIGAAAVGSPDDATVRRICCAMVIRAMSAGTSGALGVTQSSWTASPYGGSQTFSQPSGDLYLTSQERRELGQGRGRIGYACMIGGD